MHAALKLNRHTLTIMSSIYQVQHAILLPSRKDLSFQKQGLELIRYGWEFE